MKPKSSEKEIQASVKEWLEANGFLVLKYNNVGIKKPDGSYIPVGRRGVCDLFAFKQGWTCVGVECKSETGKLSEAQKEFAVDFEAHGQRYVVARNIEDIIKAIG